MGRKTVRFQDLEAELKKFGKELRVLKKRMAETMDRRRALLRTDEKKNGGWNK